MQVSAKDNCIKAAVTTPMGSPSKGLQLREADHIRIRWAVLQAASTLKQVADNHPHWRVHEWKGRKGYWSIDVLAKTRLLFEYDKKSHVVSKMEYDDPH